MRCMSCYLIARSFVIVETFVHIIMNCRTPNLEDVSKIMLIRKLRSCYGLLAKKYKAIIVIPKWITDATNSIKILIKMEGVMKKINMHISPMKMLWSMPEHNIPWLIILHYSISTYFLRHINSGLKHIFRYICHILWKYRKIFWGCSLYQSCYTRLKHPG